MIPTIAWTIWLLGTLALGLAAGSFLNVAAVRLPYEKSVIWPSSRCGNCLKGLPWHSNLPIIGYIWLRGRCYWCGEVFSIRYLLSHQLNKADQRELLGGQHHSNNKHLPLHFPIVV